MNHHSPSSSGLEKNDSPFASVVEDLVKALEEKGYRTISNAFDRRQMSMALVDETCRADYTVRERAQIEKAVRESFGDLSASHIIAASRNELRNMTEKDGIVNLELNSEGVWATE